MHKTEPNKNGLKNQYGFSLIELMVVIGIISIMSAISIPFLLSSDDKPRKVARELMGDMQQTRMNAVRANQDWAIVFIPGNNEYRICSGPGPDNAWSNYGDNPTEKVVTFSSSAPGVAYGGGDAAFDATVDKDPLPGDGVSYGGFDVLTFNPRGTCAAGYAYIYYKDASYTVGTLSSGVVRIKRWNNGDWR